MTIQASSPRVLLYLFRLLPVTNRNNLFFPPVSIGSHFDNTSYNMHLLFLHKYPNKSVSDGSAENHEDFLFICFTEKNNLSRMAVGQVALADSHGPCLPAHPHPPISLSLFPSLCPSFSLPLLSPLF